MARTIRDLAREYMELAMKCIEQEHRTIQDLEVAVKCAQLMRLGVDGIERELRRLAMEFPRSCIACRYSTPAYGTPAMCDLTARFCEMGKRQDTCDSFEPFPDL